MFDITPGPRPLSMSHRSRSPRNRALLPLLLSVLVLLSGLMLLSSLILPSGLLDEVMGAWPF